jgi:hypothetical protein
MRNVAAAAQTPRSRARRGRLTPTASDDWNGREHDENGANAFVFVIELRHDQRATGTGHGHCAG